MTARVGFFTDTTLCIGCKACEVACKEWNDVPEDGLRFTGESYDNTGALGASSWRHVAFIEQTRRVEVADGGRWAAGGGARDATGPIPAGASTPSAEARGASEEGGAGDRQVRWLMSSDVCKHCTEAGCLDVCPTGALFRTEFGTVVVQADVCNGCGYCVSACPFGVIERREGDGRAWKCTLCYDRLRADLQPACSTACPTQSIQFGELDELRARARGRVEQLRARGQSDARLYGADPGDGVGGAAAFFLLLDEPEVYGLPPSPEVPTRRLGEMWASAAVAAGLMAAALAASVVRGRR